MLSVFRKIAATQAEGGKPLLRQLLEIARLRLSPSPVGIGEYFDYGIWHRSVTTERMREFIGWRQSHQLDRSLNDDYSRVLANDKLLNYLVLKAARYPIPTPVATFTAKGRRIGDEKVLRTADEVIDFLDGDIYPVYVKPISAGYGKSVVGVAGKENQGLRLMDGTSMRLDEFMIPFGFPPYHGMLFQKPLVAHPAIQAITGTEAVCCVRFICFVTSGGPHIHTAFWKITSGRNMLDNFSHGDYGNALGAIDLQSGNVVRAVSRLGPGGLIERHPTTNRTLKGFALPDWKKAADLVLSASAHFPGLRLQNWDVVLCPDGPVLLELNTESELNVPQAISGRGLMDERLRTILDDIEAEKETHRKSALLRRAMR
ncbi:MAG: sugar-transfer associated ATP-grasp domain-containing protein [Propionivibrio sp.]